MKTVIKQLQNVHFSLFTHLMMLIYKIITPPMGLEWKLQRFCESVCLKKSLYSFVMWAKNFLKDLKEKKTVVMNWTFGYNKHLFKVIKFLVASDNFYNFITKFAGQYFLFETLFLFFT